MLSFIINSDRMHSKTIQAVAFISTMPVDVAFISTICILRTRSFSFYFYKMYSEITGA